MTYADTSPHFSLLKEAAALIEAGGGTTSMCPIHETNGRACTRHAQFKLADTDSAATWARIRHADEILITVPAAFIASHNEDGLGEFLTHRGPGRRS